MQQNDNEEELQQDSSRRRPRPPKEPREAQQPQVDYQKAMLELYDNVIWCVNTLNRIVGNYPNLLNPPNQYQDYQQFNPTPQPYQPEPPVTTHPDTPTFTKRNVPFQPEPVAPATPVKKPWYKQKGIIFSIILAIVMMYFIYLFIMKSTGHAIMIPGLGKF